MTKGTRENGPKVKGVAFRTIYACFEDLRGLAKLEESRRLMPDDLAQAYRNGTLLAASWYPIEGYRAVFDAFRTATGEGPALARQIGVLAVRKDMQGPHKKLFAMLVSPLTLLRIAGRVFSTYYDTGECRVIASRSGFAQVKCDGCVGWDQNMWSEFIGSCESQLEIAGARNVRIRTLSGGREQDAAIEVEAYWT